MLLCSSFELELLSLVSTAKLRNIRKISLIYFVLDVEWKGWGKVI